MPALLITTMGSLALLALAFMPLERMFPARAGQRALRPGLHVDLLFFAGQYLLWSSLALSLLLGARGLLAAVVPGAFRAWVAAWPSWAQIVAAVALGDLAVYWFHRACHAFEPLWRFHAVHHSAEHLDFVAAHREHPLDGIVTQLCVNLPAFAMSFPLHHIAGFLALRGMWAVFIHSNVQLPLGPLRWLLGAPELHRWHHARVDRTRHNFSNLAPWVDLLFGTYHRPDGPETYPLGLTGAWPEGYLAQLLHPFKSRRSERLVGIRRAPAPAGDRRRLRRLPKAGGNVPRPRRQPATASRSARQGLRRLSKAGGTFPALVDNRRRPPGAPGRGSAGVDVPQGGTVGSGGGDVAYQGTGVHEVGSGRLGAANHGLAAVALAVRRRAQVIENEREALTLARWLTARGESR